jgi:hypothetical protein
MVTKKWIFLAIVILIPLVSGQVNWVPENDLDIVCEMAKVDDKLVLVYIYDEWTEKSDRIFDDPTVHEYINEHFYGVRLYRGDVEALCERYAVEKGPTVLFLDVYAQEIGRIENLTRSDEFYSDMESILEATELRETLKDYAYRALTEADSLYAQEEYRESKEMYTIAMEKFQLLGNTEREEYCKSRISSADLRMQVVLLRYGLIMFVSIAIFLALIYYVTKRG